jgi:hypothetical protein
MRFWLATLFFVSGTFISNAQRLHASDSTNWNSLNEGHELTFKIYALDSIVPKFTLEGVNGYGMQFDSLGNFYWRPSFDLVDRLEKQREVSVIAQAEWKDGKRVRKTLNFTVLHQNRPPVVEDLPVFYVKQSSANRYQIPSEYVVDPDSDPLVFKSIQSQLPEGVVLSSLGLLTWTPSRNQFNNLKNNPLLLEFVVQDQPEKAEVRGKIRIAQTQLDLPPEMLATPVLPLRKTNALI